MNTSRLAILAGLAVAIAIVAATQTCSDRSSTPNEPVAKAAPKSGVSPRATDTPIDLRERDRLREDDPTAPATPPTGVPATPDATAEVPPPLPERKDPGPPAEQPIVVGPPPSPTIEAAALAAKAAAQDEVAKVRGDMRRKCWDGFDRGGKGGSGVTLTFSLGFDAEGHVLASSVQQTRDDYIQGLETCLGPFAHAIEVPAPGESLSVDVEVDFP
jgi:hypothetical protein